MTDRGTHARMALDGVDTYAYVARPERSPPYPAVLVVHEVFGLNDDIRRIADRFAANGYFAVAPELMPDGRVRGVARSFRQVSRGEGPMVDRGRAALRRVADHPDVDADRVGVTGFCMGGGFAFLLGTDDAASATAPNYGAIPDDDTLRELCPVVASYGGEDRLSDGVDRLEATLTDAGIDHDVKVYPGVGHSFMNRADLNPAFALFGSTVMSAGYDEAAAEDAWSRILGFFDDHLRGERAGRGATDSDDRRTRTAGTDDPGAAGTGSAGGSDAATGPRDGYVQSRGPPVPDVAYEVINPAVSLLLRSPLHSLVSDSLMLITFTGRRSGEEYTTPVGYWVRDGNVIVTTHSPWWRNLRGGQPVTLRLRGERREGVATPHPEPEVVAEYVETFVDRNGVDAARRLGVQFAGDREPTREELEAGVEGTVVIEIELTDGGPPP